VVSLQGDLADLTESGLGADAHQETEEACGNETHCS